MDSLVQSIVQEVINGTSDKHERQTSPKQQDYSIARPNYQRQKAQARMTGLPQTTRPPAQAKPSATVQAKPPVATPIQSASANLGGSLGLLGLSASTPSIAPKKHAKCGCQSDASGMQSGCVLIEKPQKQLLSMLQMVSQTGDSLLVMQTDRGMIEKLFVLDMILQEQWARDYRLDLQTGSMSLTLCGKTDKMERAMVALQARGQAVAQVETPSNFLMRMLKIGSRSVAGLDDIDRMSYLPLINQYYLDHAESSIEFIPYQNGLLAQGSLDEVVAVLTQFDAQRQGGLR